MALNPRAVFRRNRFQDSDTWSEFLYHAGAQPGIDFELYQVTGYFGALLKAIWGEPPNPLSSYNFLQQEQKRRPDIFVAKLRSRHRFKRTSESDRHAQRPPSTLVTPKQFAEHYAAAAFAFAHGLLCETGVTLWWGRLGAHDAASAEKMFSRFLKDLNDWLYQRHLPTAYFFCHENSPLIGLHTHLAVYLCVMKYSAGTRHEFRRWAMTWSERNSLGVQPRAIRVSGPTEPSPWIHWLRFHYQVKGYDPRAVVRRALNAPSRTDVMLEDLIAWPWRDPGEVTMRPRLDHALNLGPARRQIGIPDGLVELRNPPRRPAPVVPREFILGAQFENYRPTPAPLPPFASRFEDGWRDVRALYPLEFNTRVTKLSYEPELPRPAREWAEPLGEIDLI